jgi:hypothetical protein
MDNQRIMQSTQHIFSFEFEFEFDVVIIEGKVRAPTERRKASPFPIK